MGWSCNMAAAEALDRVKDACVRSTGQTNVWEERGQRYFFEASRTEHHDGAITGSVWRSVPSLLGPSETTCRRVGSFRIEGDGRMSRGPAFMRGTSVRAPRARRVWWTGGAS